MFEKLSESVSAIQQINNIVPKVGIVLGSGLGVFVNEVEDQVVIPYSEIPHFHNTSVEGHEGRLILGKVSGVNTAILQGRLHGYEGLDMNEVVFPVRVLATLGIESLILTNAAGGINESFSPGDLICIQDHINLSGKNPLVGPNISEMGPRFPDMTEAYNPKLREIILSSAKELDYNMKSGVYCSVLGPTYETPAEIKMMRILGGDMVGMSTVPESIAANHLGLKVAGISCITNMGAGIHKGHLKHEDIKSEAEKVMNTFSSLLKKSIEKIGRLD